MWLNSVGHVFPILRTANGQSGACVGYAGNELGRAACSSGGGEAGDGHEAGWGEWGVRATMTYIGTCTGTFRGGEGGGGFAM